MKTEYNPEHAKFSDLAHRCAKTLIYPKIFNSTNLEYQSTLVEGNEKDAIYDGEMGIDRIVYVTVDGLKSPLKFTVQERFRGMEYSRFRDLTVTEWNHNSNLPSELYKINAGIFLYGYFDDIKLRFGEIVLINTVDLLYQLSLDNIEYKTNINTKNQTFLSFDFDNLTLMYHTLGSEGIDKHIDMSQPLLSLREKAKRLDLPLGTISKFQNAHRLQVN